jgi:hypothetical protein
MIKMNNINVKNSVMNSFPGVCTPEGDFFVTQEYFHQMIY